MQQLTIVFASLNVLCNAMVSSYCDCGVANATDFSSGFIPSWLTSTGMLSRLPSIWFKQIFRHGHYRFKSSSFTSKRHGTFG
jgi:hypothetical protein